MQIKNNFTIVKLKKAHTTNIQPSFVIKVIVVTKKNIKVLIILIVHSTRSMIRTAHKEHDTHSSPGYDTIDWFSQVGGH